MRLGAALCLGTLLILGGAPAAVALPPSPFPDLEPRALTPGFIDAAPVCLPGADRPELEIAVARVRDADFAGARRALEFVLAEAGQEVARDVVLALAVLEVREGADLRSERAQLEAALRSHPRGRARTCARLELARLELRARRTPEALAEIVRAEREHDGDGFPAPLAATAIFYRSEAAVLEERRVAARGGYEELAPGPDARLARAARLRLADLALGWPVPAAAEGASAGWKQLRALLADVREQGLDIASWSVRAAELAIAAGHFGEAHRWLARAEGLDASGFASIRKADVLVALERPEDARVVLERVAESAARPAARELAQIRRAAYGLGSESADERALRLRRAARSAHPRISALAGDALAGLLLDEGDLPAAIAELARIAHSGAYAEAVPDFQRTLDATLRAAARPELDCPRVLERLGGRRDLFVRLGSELEPFLRLGDCFLGLGMPEQALEIYRGLVRRFGAGPETGLPLRVARASLAAGDLPVLRATLEAHFAQRASPSKPAAGEGEAQWLWLRAQLALRDGREAEVAEQLAALARDEALAAELRVAVERALVTLDGEAIEADLLGRTLAASLARPVEGVPAEQRAEAWLRLADLQRTQGRADVSRAAYERALALLPEGARRDRARFAVAMLASDSGGVSEALEQVGEAGAAEPWVRLVRLEGRLIRLRAAVDGGEKRP